MKPRVLVATKAFWPVIGGVEKTVYDIARATALDYDITILAVSERRSSSTETYEDFTVVKTAKLAKVFSAPLSLGFIPAFQRLARDADIVHLHSPYPLGELCLNVSRVRAKVIDTYHFDVVRQRILAPIYNPLLHASLDRTDLIVCSNPNLKRTSPILQQHKSKVEVIPFGIDYEEFQLRETEEDEAKTLRKRYARPLVLFVGRLVYYKGIEQLVRAAARVNVDLVIIGDGPLEGSLRKEAASLRIEDRVHFLSHLPRRDLKLYFHACDLFVLPSVARSEAFGLVLLEAMAAGKPLVTTELGTGTSWINQHDQTGFVVPARDPQALADSIDRIISTPELARRFAVNATARVKQVYSRSEYNSSYLDIYRRLLDRVVRSDPDSRGQ